MSFHLFVACCVYATAIVVGIIYTIYMFARLCDPRYRAQLRRKMRKFIVRILKKFVKD